MHVSSADKVEFKRVLIDGEVISLERIEYEKDDKRFVECSFSKDGVNYTDISEEEYEAYCASSQFRQQHTH